MSIEKVTFEGGRKLQAGWISTRKALLAADTYFVGMLLEYNTTNDNLEILSTGLLAGIYNGEDGRILGAEGTSDVIVAGEISESGIVDGAGDALALTADQIEAFRIAGFYMKEV